jgi:hypothetical protein
MLSNNITAYQICKRFLRDVDENVFDTEKANLTRLSKNPLSVFHTLLDSNIPKDRFENLQAAAVLRATCCESRV